jgi:hypothetical protein
MKKIIILIAFLLNTTAQAAKVSEAAKKEKLNTAAQEVQNHMNIHPDSPFSNPENPFRGLSYQGIHILYTSPYTTASTNPAVYHMVKSNKSEGFMENLKNLFFTTKVFRRFDPVAFAKKLNEPENKALRDIFIPEVNSNDFTQKLIDQQLQIKELIKVTSKEETATKLTTTTKILLAGVGATAAGLTLYHYFKRQ